MAPRQGWNMQMEPAVRRQPPESGPARGLEVAAEDGHRQGQEERRSTVANPMLRPLAGPSPVPGRPVNAVAAWVFLFSLVFSGFFVLLFFCGFLFSFLFFVLFFLKNSEHF
jgi:hypothetical protein